jgi:hypothetical protein
MRLGASQQQEATMAKEVTGNFEIPREMRALAEQSVEQARKAFDGFMTAAQKAASGMEGQASAAHAGAKDVRQKTMTFAEANVAIAVPKRTDTAEKRRGSTWDVMRCGRCS